MAKKEKLNKEEVKKKNLTNILSKVNKKKTTNAAKIKAKLVFEDWKSNNFKGLQKSMHKIGYGRTMGPSHLERTKAWKDILNEALPDSLLAEKHLELINARKSDIIYEDQWEKDKNGELVRMRKRKIVDLGPDLNSVSKGLEMAYKLKGAFNTKPEGEDSRPPNSTIYNLFYKPEIRDSVKQLEAALTKQLYGKPLEDDDGEIPEFFGGKSTAIDVTPTYEDGNSKPDGGNPGEDGSPEK